MAVVAVVAYHLGFRWAKGGYLGVDSFLVLSGFLITSGLLRDHSRSGAVRLRSFWARRLRRLVPALVLVVGAVAVYAAVVALPDEARSLRLDGISALAFVSNWRFVASSQGYFGQSSAPSLLRHTWSLAVEAQLYLLWPPVVALVLARSGRRAVGVVAGALAIVSAGLGMALVPVAGAVDRAYYGTDTRAAAFLVGAAVACALAVPGTRGRRLTGVLGAGGAVVTVVLWWALGGTSLFLFRGGLPLAAACTAAVIVDAVRRPAGSMARALSFAPLRLLGQVSYGVYLWHWPLFLVLNHARTGLSGVSLVAVRLGAVTVATTLSWILVERPILERKPLVRVRMPAVLRPAVAVAVVGSVVAGLVVAGGGVATTVQLAGAGSSAGPPASVAGPAAPAGAVYTAGAGSTALPAASSGVVVPGGDASAQPASAVAATAGARAPASVVLLGDSVAWTLGRGLITAERPYGVVVHDDAVIGCGVATGTEVRSIGVTSAVPGRCLAWEQAWQAAIDRDRPAVSMILLGRWELLDRVVDGTWQHLGMASFDSYVTARLERAIAIAGSGGARVVLCTVPYFQGLESAAGAVFPENQPARADRFNQLVREVAFRHPGVVLFDLNGLVSPGGRYASTIGGVAVRDSDGVHFSLPGGAFVATGLLPVAVRAATVRG